MGWFSSILATVRDAVDKHTDSQLQEKLAWVNFEKQLEEERNKLTDAVVQQTRAEAGVISAQASVLKAQTGGDDNGTES